TITTQVGRYSSGNSWKTGNYGTVTLNPAGGSYKAGESVTISVSNIHGDGYTFQKWERWNGQAWETESNNQSFTYEMPSYNVQFRAVFK
ncbi:MAG: hypothetical protein GX248_00035, partial [Peptococcaceae bacterium]|nr:hypothetical protein [Peptococcaceae bacterium]